jgi:hypothetical protein
MTWFFFCLQWLTSYLCMIQFITQQRAKFSKLMHSFVHASRIDIWSQVMWRSDIICSQNSQFLCKVSVSSKFHLHCLYVCVCKYIYIYIYLCEMCVFHVHVAKLDCSLLNLASHLQKENKKYDVVQICKRKTTQET